jgi:hypothetical protein
VNKKTKKLIKSRKLEKNNRKNQTMKKKLIKILKKPTGSVRFYKSEIEKTEPNPNRKNIVKPEKNSQNQVKLKKTEPN